MGTKCLLSVEREDHRSPDRRTPDDLETPAGNLSLEFGLCAFVYEDPKEAKPVVRAEAELTTVSELYELREPLGKASVSGWSTS
jgi:hypothetical protein